jgi:uncharacterized HhH-GPD family protein
MTPTSIPWTDDENANTLLASDPNALLIGFVLDQQVTVQKAFSGPLVLRERLGHLDPTRIATLDPDTFAAVCAERPAIHRFPAAMAGRIQELCRVISRDYHGDASRIWRDAADGADLYARLGALPGLGAMKIGSLATLLCRQYGVSLDGLDERLPTHPVLGAVASRDELAAYQEHKRDAKRRARAAKSGS